MTWGGHPAIAEMILTNKLSQGAMGRAMGAMAVADRRAIQMLLVLRRSNDFPPNIGEGFRTDPPSPGLQQQLRAAVLATATGRYQANAERALRFALAWQDKELLKLLQESIRNQRKSSQKTRVTTVLAWNLETNPSPAAATLLAASAPEGKELSTWTFAELAAKNPDIIKWTGAKPPNPEKEAEDAATIRKEANTKIIDDALVALRGLKRREFDQALSVLGKADVLPDRREEVFAAIRSPRVGYHESNSNWRAAFCRWSGPEEAQIVAFMGRTSRDLNVKEAAIRALIANKSRHLKHLAFSQVHENWTPGIRDAWRTSGPVGEAAFCHAIAKSNARSPKYFGVRRPAIEALAECGGVQARTLLASLLDQPPLSTARDSNSAQTKKAIEQAIARLDFRIAQANKPKEEAAKPETTPSDGEKDEAKEEGSP